MTTIVSGVVAAISLIVAVVFQVLHYLDTIDDDYTPYGCVSAAAFYIFLISFFVCFGSG